MLPPYPHPLVLSSKSAIRSLLQLSLWLLLAVTVVAEDRPANPPASPAPAPPAAPAPAPDVTHQNEAHPGHAAVKTTAATGPLTKVRQADGSEKVEVSASLGMEVTVSIAPGDVADFEKLVTAATDEKPLTLYLNCLPMKLPPVAICYDREKHPEEVRFALLRTADNEMQWRTLLHSLQDREVSIAVGLSGEPKSAIKAGKFRLLIVADWVWFWIAVAIIVSLLLLLVVYGTSTNLLRDLSPHLESEFEQKSQLAGRLGLSARKLNGLKRPPFSLGRVQMAFWFALIATSYLFLWLVLGERNSFNTTALTLLGLSLGTGLLSRTIDVSKQNQAGDLEAERQELTKRKTALEALTAAEMTDALRAELEKIKTRLPEIDRLLKDQTVPTAEHVSEGFLTDILSDQNGISLHRLQMVGWTLILGLVFVANVRTTLAMPTFDNTLLGLMGISSGAFLGFKVPEKKTTAANP